MKANRNAGSRVKRFIWTLCIVLHFEVYEARAENSKKHPVHAQFSSARILNFSTLNSNVLWVDPESQSARDVSQLLVNNPTLAATLAPIAQTPQALWLGEWSGDVFQVVHKLSQVAQEENKILTLVVYRIPFRDCGGQSAAGTPAASLYRDWISTLAEAIGSASVLLVLEPDALAQLDCLSEPLQKERLELLNQATKTLQNLPHTQVYLDAGHPAWQSVKLMAERLLAAGSINARGFALNVSNFQTLEANLDYGDHLSQMVGGAHFIVDTSRNGNGPSPTGEWCNPRGVSIGELPSLETHHELADAFLWVKRPGESDGECNGGPAAGVWWREYALELLRNHPECP